MIWFLLPILEAETEQEAYAGGALNIGIAIFALVLLALSISAFRKTRLDRLLVVSAAFGLFAVEVLVRQVDAVSQTFSSGMEGVILAGLDFLILLLFFVAVVRK